MTVITITNPGVNGGTAIEFHNSKVSYSWKNLLKVTPSPQKFDTIQGDLSGWENPRIVIEGFFDIDDLDTNEVRQAHLINLAKVQYTGSTATTSTLAVYAGNSATETNLLAADASTSTVKVLVDSFSIDFDAVSSEKGHIWRFTLSLIETQ
jgi:hypothetical protein